MVCNLTFFFSQEYQKRKKKEKNSFSYVGMHLAYVNSIEHLMSFS
jgi:hypothetical protein